MAPSVQKVTAACDAAGIPYDRPADWGAVVDYDGWAVDQSDDQVFVHWGGTQVRGAAAAGNVHAERAVLRGWEHYHLHTKGWRGIAYDFGVGNSGRVYLLRGNGRSAGTSGDVDEDGIPNNAESDAVAVLIGEGQEASPEALASLRVVVDALAPGNGVYGHREAGGIATACPGGQLLRWVVDYRDGELDTPDGEDETETPPAPADTDTTTIGAIVNDLPTLKAQPAGRWKHDVDVLTVQAQSTFRWGLPTKIDGFFGADTERKVREIQQRARVRDGRVLVDGIVGPQTWFLLLLGRLGD